MAAADSIRTLIGSNRELGRFRRDTTLVTNANHVLAEVDTLRALFTNPVGTMPRRIPTVRLLDSSTRPTSFSPRSSETSESPDAIHPILT